TLARVAGRGASWVESSWGNAGGAELLTRDHETNSHARARDPSLFEHCRHGVARPCARAVSSPEGGTPEDEDARVDGPVRGKGASGCEKGRRGGARRP